MRKILICAAVLGFAIAALGTAKAQTQFPTAAGPFAPVVQWVDGSGVAHPTTVLNPLPISSPVTTPVSASTEGAATATLAISLPAAAGKTTYITGFAVDCFANTALALGFISVTGPTGAELYAINESTLGSEVKREFTSPLPASAVNTAISVALGGAVGGATCTVNAEGFQK